MAQVSRKALIALAVIVVIIGGSALWFYFQSSATASTTLKVAIGTDLDTVDPDAQTTTTVGNVMRHVFEGLTWYDANGNLIPWLATGWNISSDGLTYTLYLRKGVKFQDGSDFNAQAVALNLKRWLDPRTRVIGRSNLGPIKDFQVINNYTIKITLAEPYPPFLRALAGFWIASPKVIEKVNITGTITDPIGTGPYKFSLWEKGKDVVLERFDDYWGVKPSIKTIKWEIIPDASTREAAYPSLKNDPNLKVFTPLDTRIMFVALLPKGPLKDPRVRQALNYAVNKTAIIDTVLFGLGKPLTGLVPPNFFGYSPQPPYHYNVTKAKELLAEAGYPNGFSMVLLHPTGRYLQDVQVAEAIQAYLAQIDVSVKLVTMDWPSFVQNVLLPLNQTKYDAVLIGWGGEIPDAHFYMYYLFESTEAPPHGLAMAHYSNPVVDDLLKEAINTVNSTKREELYAKAASIIWQDAPWIFLYQPYSLFAARKNVNNVFFGPDHETMYFWNATLSH
ncbi:MAG: ABC transporter substrate-binding protein [Candidatus Brockarchaeota archaeon]|nr:ABC transporter substrate-binding protein [Candidatus Brockarchaeota archaeon]